MASDLTKWSYEYFGRVKQPEIASFGWKQQQVLTYTVARYLYFQQERNMAFDRGIILKVIRLYGTRKLPNCLNILFHFKISFALFEKWIVYFYKCCLIHGIFVCWIYNLYFWWFSCSIQLSLFLTSLVHMTSVLRVGSFHCSCQTFVCLFFQWI